MLDSARITGARVAEFAPPQARAHRQRNPLPVPLLVHRDRARSRPAIPQWLCLPPEMESPSLSVTHSPEQTSTQPRTSVLALASGFIHLIHPPYITGSCRPARRSPRNRSRVRSASSSRSVTLMGTPSRSTETSTGTAHRILRGDSAGNSKRRVLHSSQDRTLPHSSGSRHSLPAAASGR